jgi:DNA-binding transcriptional LysR family regulator
MQQFMSLYPEARVQLECLHPHKVVDAVLKGEADLGIMSYPPADRALTVVPLREEPMALVCHPGHRLARRRLVLPADLNGEAFVAFDPELTIRKAIDRALRQHNVRVNVMMEFDNIETIKQAIIIAAGVSILPRHVVEKEAGGGAGRVPRPRAAGGDHPPPAEAADAHGEPLRGDAQGSQPGPGLGGLTGD